MRMTVRSLTPPELMVLGLLWQHARDATPETLPLTHQSIEESCRPVPVAQVFEDLERLGLICHPPKVRGDGEMTRCWDATQLGEEAFEHYIGPAVASRCQSWVKAASTPNARESREGAARRLLALAQAGGWVEPAAETPDNQGPRKRAGHGRNRTRGSAEAEGEGESVGTGQPVMR
ncbi:MAG TPA: hypothetical protein PLU35_13805 [Phycisphaerales bacterium]|nr:hypothetical protein [Phycisphaerales bacterium]